MDTGESGRKGYQNIHPVIGVLVANRIATLNELKTVYSMEDAMDMYEAFIIPKFNEWREVEKMKNKAKK